jgi:hypothetical protein
VVYARPEGKHVPIVSCDLAIRLRGRQRLFRHPALTLYLEAKPDDVRTGIQQQHVEDFAEHVRYLVLERIGLPTKLGRGCLADYTAAADRWLQGHGYDTVAKSVVDDLTKQISDNGYLFPEPEWADRKAAGLSLVMPETRPLADKHPGELALLKDVLLLLGEIDARTKRIEQAQKSAVVFQPPPHIVSPTPVSTTADPPQWMPVVIGSTALNVPASELGLKGAASCAIKPPPVAPVQGPNACDKPGMDWHGDAFGDALAFGDNHS